MNQLFSVVVFCWFFTAIEKQFIYLKNYFSSSFIIIFIPCVFAYPFVLPGERTWNPSCWTCNNIHIYQRSSGTSGLTWQIEPLTHKASTMFPHLTFYWLKVWALPLRQVSEGQSGPLTSQITHGTTSWAQIFKHYRVVFFSICYYIFINLSLNVWKLQMFSFHITGLLIVLHIYGLNYRNQWHRNVEYSRCFLNGSEQISGLGWCSLLSAELSVSQIRPLWSGCHKPSLS